ncbi:spermidine synthase [Bacillus sp. DTU_2020_1000418_1_SI_GHA_SEK_038]|uniref:spermine/spermidine synthase domain-containing protein n=1 Tax=Bacillus sp. DTU_2020_1000418_1_SI_GHA_SEK_038 TaxID=3077585 RepID=UPI0028E55055|nr:spermidine synthase [Bacillus sp. DTU_2020_1000418_1_SI_GHA_SEK_038]WNS76279.1 spermidine synthase [Bacillus sp. DTU_2020_1000418_1_SI_GHA_SEK_038]
MSNTQRVPWLSQQVKAGCKSHQLPINQKLTFEDQSINRSSRGDKWDQVGLLELLAGKHKKLYDGKSKYQDIKIVEATDIRMYLNEQLQFSSLDERIYHEAFVHIPMALTRWHERILILGGGDGLALREVLKYSDVKQVHLVDLDEKVLNIARNVPAMATMNDRAFFDKRVHVFAQDAIQFVEKSNQKYDLIIIDFPDPTVPILANLYTLELYQMLYNRLAEDGMIVCQSNSIDETPIVFWSIGRTMEAARFYTEAYHTVIPSFGDWGFHLAAKNPFSTNVGKINVTQRTLPNNINTMFSMPKGSLKYKDRAVINSKDHLVLHEIFNREVGDYT